ncbi:MAG: YceI family protein [Planctomycetota bacterium]
MHRACPNIRRTAICCTSIVLALASTIGVRADQYAIEPSHTSIIFGISHLGYSYTYGRFNDVKGAFIWDNANPAAGNFQVGISVASIDSNDEKRDQHLRAADFFNANQFPLITFQSTSVRPSTVDNANGNMFDVTGNFTMHGVTKQVTLPMKKLGEGQGPYGKYRCGFFCQTTIKRSEFGMTNMVPNIGDEVAVTISFEGVRQATAGSGNAPSAGSGSAAKPAGSASAPVGPAGAPSGSSGAR